MGKPLVLVGETRSKTNLACLQSLGWGRMFVTRKPSPYPYEPWGFDNGAFPAWLRGQPLIEADFERRLEDAHALNSDPYLAVCPDIVAAGLHSLDYSMRWIRRLPDDWPWYLAVQDGMTPEDVEPCIGPFAGLFLGGTDRFKATAYRWCQLAHKHQRKFHYGRASTPGKLRSAFKVGSDSCDSSFPLWTQDRMRIFTARWTGLEDQHMIEYDEAPNLVNGQAKAAGG